MSWHVYMLQSERDGRLYKGIAESVAGRLARHNAGTVRSTKAYRPWRLIHTEQYPLKTDALKRERYFKTRSGYRELKRLATSSRAAGA